MTRLAAVVATTFGVIERVVLLFLFRLIALSGFLRFGLLLFLVCLTFGGRVEIRRGSFEPIVLRAPSGSLSKGLLHIN